MSRTLYLHIGLTKTGSTSLQRFFSGRRKSLLKGGVCYPSSLGGVSHTGLVSLAQEKTGGKGRRRAAGGLPRGTATEQLANAFDAEMRALPDEVRDVVMSSEHCSIRLRDAPEIARLKALLTPYFSTIKVIVYLRRQDLHLASQYSQMLRRGMIRYPDTEEIWPEFAAAYHYDALLERWAAVFGREALVPRLFQRDTLVNGDAVQDFLATTGLNDRFGRAAASLEINPSINPQGQALLLELGLLMKQAKKANKADKANKAYDWAVWQRLTNTVTGLYAGKGWQPSRAQAAALMARYAPSNEAVRQAWFPTRASLFDTDDSFLPEQAVDLASLDVRPAALAVALELARKGTVSGAAAEEES